LGVWDFGFGIWGFGFGFWDFGGGGRTTFAATSYVPCAINAPKIRFWSIPDRKRILVYVEPRKRVWWLQMSYFL